MSSGTYVLEWLRSVVKILHPCYITRVKCPLLRLWVSTFWKRIPVDQSFTDCRFGGYTTTHSDGKRSSPLTHRDTVVGTGSRTRNPDIVRTRIVSFSWSSYIKSLNRIWQHPRPTRSDFHHPPFESVLDYDLHLKEDSLDKTSIPETWLTFSGWVY